MHSPTNKSGRVTLRDVAARAGVSVQTASHVMSGNMTVRLPESTRERVKAAAAALNYRPNRHAVAIRRGKTDVIGVWMPINRPIITYLRMLQAASECASKSGYEIMIVGLDRTEAIRDEGKVPTDWPVDGILTIDSGRAAMRYRQDPSGDGTPICVLGLEEVANGDRVSWDLLGAAKKATLDMIAGGRTSIVHVTPSWIFNDFPRERRRRGYCEAMEEAGLVPRIVVSQGETSQAAQAAVAEFLDQGHVIDGFFGFTDTYAVGAARAALRAGLKIPEDVVVWGAGDYPEASDFSVPISTLRLPIHDVIETAWARLLERVKGEAPEENRLHFFDMEFVGRESTGCGA